MDRLDMLPTLAKCDIRDRCLAHAKLLCDSALRYPSIAKATNFNHLIGRQSRCMYGLALRLIGFIHSALVDHIRGVVGLSAEKQVPRIATRRIIAFVTNIHTWRDWAKTQFPSHAACNRTNVASAIPLAESELSISIRIATGLPLPTFIGAALRDFLPKAFIDRARGFGSSPMAYKESDGESLNKPQANVGAGRDGSWCPTTTQAKSTRIRIVGGAIFAGIMSVYEAFRLVFNPTLCGVGTRGKFGQLAATTFAVSIAAWLRGTIGVHRNSSFLCLIRRRGETRWPVFSFLLQVYYSTCELRGEVCYA